MAEVSEGAVKGRMTLGGKRRGSVRARRFGFLLCLFSSKPSLASHFLDMAFLFSPAAISISFPSQKTRIFHPGDVVAGVIHLRLDVDSKGKHAMERVVVQLGGKMVTTFAFRPTIASATAAQARQNAAEDLKEATAAGGVKKVGAQQDGNGVELYREETELVSFFPALSS